MGRGSVIPDDTPQSDKKKVAAVIAAHPDDPDFGAGGTAALWSAQGDWEFHYVIVTNGAKGSADPDMSREKLVPMREIEQRNAAEALGVLSCTFLGGEDGELEYTRETLGKIVREIRRLKPDAVFTHSDNLIHRNPFRAAADDEQQEYIGFVNHRDHRTTGIMSVDAVYPTARDRMNFPEHLAEGLETHNVRELYIWGSNEPNFAVDISDVIDQKARALTEHVSQFAHRGDDFIKRIKERWRDADDRYYERYKRVTLPM